MGYVRSRSYAILGTPLRFDQFLLEMKALVVCHVGEGIGLGHLSRCLVIAKALTAKLGCDVRFLICGSFITHDDLCSYEVCFVSSEAELEQRLMLSVVADLVVLDLHPQRIPLRLAEAVQAVRTKGSRVVAVDCLVDFRDSLDLIFIPSFQCDAEQIENRGAPIVFGWDCYLLNLSDEPKPWRPGRKVLVLTGGSDATGLGETWPNLLDACLPLNTELHWVSGPFATRPKWVASPRIWTCEHRALSGLGKLMSRVHYAITVYGVSFFELLYLGIPTVVFSPYGTKDVKALQEIDNAGIAFVAKDEVQATRKLTALMESGEDLRGMSMKAQRKMKARGADRFVEEICRLFAAERSQHTFISS